MQSMFAMFLSVTTLTLGVDAAPPTTIPAGMVLPSGESDFRCSSRAPVVAITKDAVFVNGERVGEPLSSDGARAMVEAINRAVGEPTRPTPWPVLALAMDRGTDLARARSIAEWLRRAGMARALLVMDSGYCFTVALVAEPPANVDLFSLPPLGLGVALADGVVTLSVDGSAIDPSMPAGPAASIDRVALRARFLDIKKKFPTESQVLVITRRGKLQDLVDAADAVRTTGAMGVAMFDRMLWLTPKK